MAIWVSFDPASGTITLIPDGSVALPGLAFASETSTGIYRPGAGQIGFAVLGNKIFAIDANGIDLSSGKRIRMRGSVSGTLDVTAAPATTSHAYVLPAAQGANHTTLHNDGSGNLTWELLNLVNDITAILPSSNGGTGVSSTAVYPGSGDIPFFSGFTQYGVLLGTTNANIAALAPNASTARFLKSGGAAANPTWSQVTLTTDVTGILPTANGGTGVNSTATFPSSGTVLTDTNILTTFAAPTRQIFTSGSGTYTKPAACRYIVVEMVGGGGGGGCSGSSVGSVATAGGSTTFGSSFLTCTGGGIGALSADSGAGGTGTINAGGSGFTMPGGRGSGGAVCGTATTNASPNMAGAVGGGTPFGAGGGGGNVNNGGTAVGLAAPTNSGSGGGSAGVGAANGRQVGSAGSGGGYLKALIASPSSTYAYAVGAGGSGETSGGGGFAGGAGASGQIIVWEYYL